MPGRGLGPRGHQALDRAAAEIHAPVIGNPSVVTREDEREAVDEDSLNWLPFNSSRVAEAAYDGQTGQLYVRWVKTGDPYVYPGVTRQEWRNFRRSASAGKYVNRVLNGKDYFRGSF